jgi:hypothetical protein
MQKSSIKDRLPFFLKMAMVSVIVLMFDHDWDRILTDNSEVQSLFVVLGRPRSKGNPCDIPNVFISNKPNFSGDKLTRIRTQLAEVGVIFDCKYNLGSPDAAVLNQVREIGAGEGRIKSTPNVGRRDGSRSPACPAEAENNFRSLQDGAAFVD